MVELCRTVWIGNSTVASFWRCAGKSCCVWAVTCSASTCDQALLGRLQVHGPCTCISCAQDAKSIRTRNCLPVAGRRSTLNCLHKIIVRKPMKAVKHLFLSWECMRYLNPLQHSVTTRPEKVLSSTVLRAAEASEWWTLTHLRASNIGQSLTAWGSEDLLVFSLRNERWGAQQRHLAQCWQVLLAICMQMIADGLCVSVLNCVEQLAKIWSFQATAYSWWAWASCSLSRPACLTRYDKMLF